MKALYSRLFWVVLVLSMLQYRPLSAQLNLSSKTQKDAILYCVKILEDTTSSDLMRTEALQYVESKAQEGSAEAQYELSKIYLQGKGVSADLPKAFEIALQSDKSYARNAYRLGYMYYKGFGCQQNYAEALSWLEKAAKAGHRGAMYLLGMAYRSGYAVSRDEAIADYWLTKAANKSSALAANELVMEQPMNPIKPIALKEALLPDASPYQKISHGEPGDFTGTYVGSMIEYDWSGQHILRQMPVTLKIDTMGNALSILWQEPGELPLQLRAKNTASGLVFTPAVRRDSMRYNHGKKVYQYEFKTAQLQVQSLGNQAYLSGNIEFYNKYEQEPSRPTYLDLIRQDRPALIPTERSIPASAEPQPLVLQKLETPQEKPFVVYPNPFTNQLNIALEVTMSGAGEIVIHNISGVRVYVQKLGTLGLGSHLFTLPIQAPVGAYFVTIRVGKKSSTTLLVKKY